MAQLVTAVLVAGAFFSAIKGGQDNFVDAIIDWSIEVAIGALAGLMITVIVLLLVAGVAFFLDWALLRPMAKLLRRPQLQAWAQIVGLGLIAAGVHWDLLGD